MENAGKEIDNEEERKALKDIGIGTPATRPAGPVGHGCASGADRTQGAFMSYIKQTVIERFTHGTCFLSADMFPHFLRNSGAILAEDNSNFLKGCAFIEFSLNCCSVI